MPMLGGPDNGSTPHPPPQYGSGLNGTGPDPSSFSYGSGARAAYDDSNKAVADAQARLKAGAENGGTDYVMGGGASNDMASLKAAADAANSPNPEYGGYTGGADDAANHYSGLGAGLALRNAPRADMTNANEARGYGTNALSLDQQAAMGNAPSAAQMQFGRNLGQSINAQAAIAGSARGGGAGLAAAQRTGATTAAGMSAQGAQDAAQLRAQEMAQARAQYGQQAVAQQGLDTNTALGVTGQQLQQEQLNQQGQLGFEQLANQAQAEQLQADTSRYGANLGAQTAANQLGSDNTWKTIGTAAKVGGSIAMAADLHLKEPSGPAHWSLREEPNFILARNERNGELRKVATEPLTPAEHRQAEAPHGAGPLGSMASPHTKVANDLDLGSADGGGTMPDPGMTAQENPFYVSRSEMGDDASALAYEPPPSPTEDAADSPSFLHRFGDNLLGRDARSSDDDSPWRKFGKSMLGDGNGKYTGSYWDDLGRSQRRDTYAADLHLGGGLSYRVHPSEGTKRGQRYDGLNMLREKM